MLANLRLVFLTSVLDATVSLLLILHWLSSKLSKASSELAIHVSHL
jgi:hypothetical protein